MTSNPESKDFIRDLSTDKVRDLSKKISLDGDNFTTPEDIQKKESLLASLQNIIEEKEDASALNADLEKIFEAFLKSEAISTLPQNPTFSQILTVFNEWKCPADVVLSFSAVDIKNYVCDLLELNDQKQQEIEKAVAEAKDAENPLKQQILENTKSIQDKIDANQQRIDELNGLITNHDATIQATIDREKAKGKNFTSQQINDYKKSLESVKATREIKKAQLIAQNQKLTQALQDSKLLEKSEADVQRHVASVEVSKDSDKSSEDWVSQANEGLEVVSVSKNPKNDKKALKWMIQGKEGFTLRFTLMDDPDLPETEKKEKLKAEKENLDKLYASTKKLDLPTVVKWLDAQTWTTEEELQNKVKTTYAGKHKGKVSDFAGFYADLHINGAEKSLANQLMQHLVQGARAGMSAIKIFNTKREVDLVNKALDEQLEKAQEQEQKSQEWLTPSEKKLIGMLADLDANGKVAGVGGEKQKKNNRIDAGNVMGTQILSAYQSAKMQLGVEKGADTEEANKILIQNLFSLLLTQREKIYKDDLSFNSRLEWLKFTQLSMDENGNVSLPDNIKTFGDVIDIFRKQPALLEVVKSSLNASSEYLTQAFIHGAKYAEDHLQREKDVFEDAKPVEAGRVNHAIADYQQYAEQHESEIKVNRDIEEKIAPEYEKYLQKLIKNLEEQKNDLKKQIAKEKDPIKKAELEEQHKALEQPNFKQSLEDLKNPTKQAEQVKKMRIDFVGALFQHYAFDDGTKSNSWGVGINVTFDNFNTWLKNNVKIFDKFSLSGGIGVAQHEKQWSPIVGLAATFSNKVGLWEGGSLVYAAGAGAWYGLGGFSVGPMGAIGIDQKIFGGTRDGKIDAKSAHYLGLVVNGSLAGRGISTYWRRDKLEGIEAQAAEKIKPALSNTLTDITKLAKGESLTLDKILKSLKKKFNKENDSELLAFASDVYTALKPYEKVLKEPDSAAKKRVIEQLTDMMTLHWLNTNKAELADSPVYLSGASLGVQFVAWRRPMPTGGISFTKFKNLYYTDDEASFNRQKETLKKGYGADTLENISFGQLATNLNITLKRKYESTAETKEGETPSNTSDFLEYDELNNTVKINKKLMEKVNLHILPELKQFVAQDGENLYVPARLPVSFVNRIDSKKTDFHLIIGSKGMGNTEFVSPNTSFDSEKGFKPYDAVKFAQDRVDVPPSVISEGKMEMISITKEYLENAAKRAQFEMRLKKACKNIPAITEIKFPTDKITNQNFMLQITFKGQVQDVWPIDYEKLGKIQYKKSLNGTETLVFTEGQTVAGQTPKLEITTYTEQKESILDKPISPESLKDTVDEKVLEYFRDFGASDVIIDFRTKKDIFNKFYKYIEAGKTDDGKNTNYEQAAKLFQDYLKTTNLKDNADLVNAFDISADKLVGNLNFIYSSLSRVRKTQHKQFGSVDRTQPNWQDKQREYMVQAKQKLWTEAQKIIEKTSLSATNKNTLKPLVEARIVNDEKNFAEIEKILGHFPAIATPTTPEKQLYCMLADYKYIASSRDSAFASLIVNEKDGVTDNKGNPYFKKGSNSYDELMKARDAVKKTLDFPFDNASERNGVGLVFAYGNGESLDGHHEKFVNSPLYVGNANTNLADITETRTKEYFLRHLEKFQKNENVLTNTIQKIKMYVNDEKKLWADLSNLTTKELINCLLSPDKKLTFTSEKGTIVIDLKADFKLGFFADCINETILMGPINIIPSGDIQSYKQDGENLVNEHMVSKWGVFTNSTITVVNPNMERKDIGVVVTGGKQKTDKPSTGETIIKDEDSKTEIKDIDLDETQLSELDQPGVDVDLWGGYIATKAEDGTVWVVGPDLPTDGILATVTPDGITFPLPSTPNAGVSVDQVAPTPTTNTRINSIDQSSNMAADALAKKAATDKK